MKCLIAGYKLELTGDSNAFLSEKLKEYEMPFSGADMVVTYKVQDEIELERFDEDIVGAGRFSWHIDNADGSVYAYTYSQSYDLCLAKITWNKDFNRADICAKDTSLIGGPSIDLKLFGLVGQAFYYMLMMHHAYVIHASAISYKGNAILFSAPSGTGKSTQTSLWKQHLEDVVYINDDNPVMRITDGEVYVYGTPWSGKHFINNNIKSRLAGIICIEQHSSVEISQIDGVTAFFRLYNEINKPVLEHMVSIFIDDLKKLIDVAKVYLMKCTISKEAVYAVKDILSLD